MWCKCYALKSCHFCCCLKTIVGLAYATFNIIIWWWKIILSVSALDNYCAALNNCVPGFLVFGLKYSSRTGSKTHFVSCLWNSKSGKIVPSINSFLDLVTSLEWVACVRTTNKAAADPLWRSGHVSIDWSRSQLNQSEIFTYSWWRTATATTSTTITEAAATAAAAAVAAEKTLLEDERVLSALCRHPALHRQKHITCTLKQNQVNYRHTQRSKSTLPQRPCVVCTPSSKVTSTQNNVPPLCLHTTTNVLFVKKIRTRNNEPVWNVYFCENEARTDMDNPPSPCTVYLPLHTTSRAPPSTPTINSSPSDLPCSMKSTYM